MVAYGLRPRPGRDPALRRPESFTRGQLVATYAAEEFFQIEARGGLRHPRELLGPGQHALRVQGRSRGLRVDFAVLAPRLSELSHGHLPEANPNPEIIPSEDPFLDQGPGVFASHFPVGGTILAVD